MLNKKLFAGAVFALAMFATALTASAFTFDSKIDTLQEKKDMQTVLNMATGSTLSIDGVVGPKTIAAVKAFQTLKNLESDGIVGPITRAALTAASEGTTPAPAVSLCPNGMTLASNCTASPAGTTPAPVVSTVGQEGSITVTYDAIPADNLSVLKGESKAVMALKIKATGSDMKVSRLWLDINKRIWLSADTATLSDGSTVLATMPLTAGTVTETTVGSAWQMQFNGLNVVVPVGTTKILTLTINRPTLTQNSESVTVAATSSVRATDGAGISTAYTITARTINLSSSAASTTGTLTTSLNANSPVAQSVAGLSTTAGVLTPVKLMDIDFKGKDAKINITQLVATLAATAGTVANEVAAVELRDGTSVLSSVTLSTATATFPTLNIDIAKDTTKTLSIWAQMNPITGAADAAGITQKGAGITATLTSASTVATDASFATVTVSSSNVVGNTMYMYQYAPTFTLGATSATSVEGSAVGKKQGNYSIAFTVTAPSGSDIYIDTPTTLTAVAKTAAYGGTLAKSSSVSGVTSKGATFTTADKVAAGTSRTFTITGTVPDGGAAGFTGMKLVNVTWTDTDHGSSPALITQTWGLSDFKTTEVYVTAS
ncbi:TPA: hypothetical protein DEP30_04010 [Candidatus Nomurabacteria bacterium]|nr:MAG: hypothetical protein UR97_C0008G0010 [Candidatus Nomurabacteria bacterium GW2011_GWE2_36_115]KKP93339.1 MAG: hypothetical protein US00_C0008G0016 [Candidatus Nomurabacteria bacterium GW2011_GWF2_36_126]KKP96395.1 MAG: hypothetical protein US04_C0002G0069 [Candidatus Nomurabacteria bacterium GW2011_GWD2_36_14]KKP99137.1 MAG: hypothetical protein US08_C0003G0031 [Candidatus Nomurabacteria bacterium GW2011_GWF2_36_19]KKQ05038.1 MAG: hypothetical protein US17_C0008G0010 [Candidatus Nomuraba